VTDTDARANADRELRVDMVVTPSWMLVPNPISIGSVSARSVAPYQTLARAASVT